MARYATVEQFEQRTGIDVPDDKKELVQSKLDDVSTLMRLYLAGCADEVEAMFGDLLTSLVCQAVQRNWSPATGDSGQAVRSKSVGNASVSYYDNSNNLNMGLIDGEKDILDQLLEAACPDDSDQVPGLGQVGANWGGRDHHRTLPGTDLQASEVDVWVVGR